jgi:sugar phosphate isomerase/epimerase
VHAQAFPDGDPSRDAHRLVDEYGVDTIETVAVPRRGVPLRTGGATVIMLGGLPLLRAGLSLSSSGADRDTAVDFARLLIDDAASCGASRLLLTSGPDRPDDRDTARAELARSLSELHRYCAVRAPDLLLSLEPTDRTIRHRQLIGPTREALEVIRACDGLIEINLDVSHLLQLGEDPIASLRLAAPHTRHVHLANCVLTDPAHPLYGEHHPPFGIPDSDVGPEQLITLLNAMSIAGYFDPAHPTTVSLEVVPPEGADPWQVADEAVRQAAAALRAATSEDCDPGPWRPLTERDRSKGRA